MAPTRPSNIERRRWRSECREKLSKHIQSRLGLMIEPSRVRLMPGPEDQYVWKWLPEYEDKLSKLFKKNLSDHSIGAYKELYEGVGKFFEAISTTVIGSTDNSGTLDTIQFSLKHPEASFSAKIEVLQEANAKLTREVSKWRDQAIAESKLRQQVEGEATLLSEFNQKLQLDARGSLLKYAQILDKVLPLLQEMRAEVSFEDGEDLYRDFHLN